MNRIVVLIILILIFLYFYTDIYGPQNNFLVYAGNGETYNVHGEHEDVKDAADMMAKVHNQYKILLAHLHKKYIPAEKTREVNNEKAGRIDVIATTSDKNIRHEKVEMLENRFRKDSLIESSPLNRFGNTSYTEGKGNVLAICLRQKGKPHDFHDMNTITFVLVHELSHINNESYGHGPDFWRNFKWMLQESVEAGIYQPVNYAVQPINYCGLDINYNPLFDNSLKTE